MEPRSGRFRCVSIRSALEEERSQHQALIKAADKQMRALVAKLSETWIIWETIIVHRIKSPLLKLMNRNELSIFVCYKIWEIQCGFRYNINFLTNIH